MDMTGEYRIAAPRQQVWEALNDPEVLKQSIPGCEEIEKESATAFTAKVTTKLGPVKARFTGAVTLSELNPPESYTISGEGKGGPAGFAKGGAKVHLTEDGDETVLSYEVNASVGGKIAQLGGRLIDSTARKMADQFFGKFAEIVVAGTSAAAPEPALPSSPPTPPTPPTPPSPPTSSGTGASGGTSAAVPPTPTTPATDPEPPAPAEPAVPVAGPGGVAAPMPAAALASSAESAAAATDTGSSKPDAQDDGRTSLDEVMHNKLEAARTEEEVSVTNPYLWVGAVIGLVIVLLLLWAFGAF